MGTPKSDILHVLLVFGPAFLVTSISLFLFLLGELFSEEYASVYLNHPVQNGAGPVRLGSPTPGLTRRRCVRRLGSMQV